MESNTLTIEICFSYRMMMNFKYVNCAVFTKAVRRSSKTFISKGKTALFSIEKHHNFWLYSARISFW